MKDIYTYNELTYVYLEDVGIKDCEETAAAVNIPSEINGKAVTALLDNAFRSVRFFDTDICCGKRN